MKKNRSENSCGLIRNIAYIKDKDDEVVNSQFLLQYYSEWKVCIGKKEIDMSLPTTHRANPKSSSIH